MAEASGNEGLRDWRGQDTETRVLTRPRLAPEMIVTQDFSRNEGGDENYELAGKEFEECGRMIKNPPAEDEKNWKVP